VLLRNAFRGEVAGRKAAAPAAKQPHLLQSSRESAGKRGCGRAPLRLAPSASALHAHITGPAFISLPAICLHPASDSKAPAQHGTWLVLNSTHHWCIRRTAWL
jgi:hypothetical protein